MSMGHLRFLLLGAGLWVGGAAGATVVSEEPVLGGYVGTFAGAPVNNQFVTDGFTPVFGTGPAEISGSSTVTADSTVSARVQSGAWSNKAEILGTSFGNVKTLGLIFSGMNINQRLEGEAGTSATLTYVFRADGNLEPGLQANMAGDFPQYVRAYLLAYRGRALGYELVQTPQFTDFRVVATGGVASVFLGQNNPNYVNTLGDDLILPGGFATGCIGDESPECGDFGPVSGTLQISFDVMVGEEFFVGTALFGRTNGTLDFFNTLELEQIVVPQGFALVAEDGGVLQRRPDGTYGLPAVPEPSTWVMLIAGFGLVGGMARRRRTANA
jgi:hypothetical protein